MIDWARVAELRQEIGPDDFNDVVDLFLEEADEVTITLRRGIEPIDVEAALHFLKGSALNLGFSTLAKICQSGERAAAGGDAKNVNILEVIDSYEQSKVAFTAGLHTVSAA